MRRRFWPALLATASLVVFASYLAYTQYLVRQIRQQGVINSRIWSLVQRGLLSPDTGAVGQELTALLDIQDQIKALGLPMLVRDRTGQYSAQANLPFEADLRTTSGQQRVADYAMALERRRPENVVEMPGVGAILFGDPPLLTWLRLVPWLQVSGALLLILVAVAVIRSDMRAERERLWAAMARELAHQMGTPLSSLEGWLEVLELPPAERVAFAPDEYIASVMTSNVERLGRVSRRFELIGKPPALDLVDVADIVEELHDYFMPRMPKFGKNIAVRMRVRDDLPAVRANSVLLAWALENIVKNAVDALGGRGGRIIIMAHPDAAGGVRVQIADDGPGIPAGLRDRIFEPGVSTKSSGWGVGLSLTRRIVQDLHQGRIAVYGRRRGGTVFDITLPPAVT